AFRSGRLLLQEPDFVAILASYHAKSAQIRELAERLNLAPDAFVFVDDNPVELAEVALALPAVRCVAFPQRDDDLARFLGTLAGLFPHGTITAEDRARTDMYRRRLAGLVPSELQGADLTRFLEGLRMTLTIHDRTRGDRARAVQLIDKTNQFNLNGRRYTDEDIGKILDAGGRLFGVTLSDRTGSPGAARPTSGCSPSPRHEQRPLERGRAVSRRGALRVHRDGRHRRGDSRERATDIPPARVPRDADHEDGLAGAVRGRERRFL